MEKIKKTERLCGHPDIDTSEIRIDDFVKQLIDIKQSYLEKGYIDVIFDDRYSYDYHEIVLIGKRWETDREFEERKKAEEKREEIQKRKKETTKKAELKLLKKLKEKYGDI
jgi:hypothetical protein